jgi:hypothetical protein
MPAQRDGIVCVHRGAVGLDVNQVIVRGDFGGGSRRVMRRGRAHIAGAHRGGRDEWGN